MQLWERFSGHARRAVLLAHDETQRAKMERIGTEHMLLGLLRLGEGMAIDILHGLDVDLDWLRGELRRQLEVGPVQKTTSEIAFTPEAQKVLSYAYNEAKNMGQTYIGTEHLLVGLVRENRGGAYRVLKESGVDLGKVRKAVQRRAKESVAPSRARRAEDFGRVLTDLGRKAGKEVVVLVVEGGRIESCVSTRSGSEGEILGYLKHLLDDEEPRRDAEAEDEGEEREKDAEE
jgi:ATP-dependent Clp protease ATP-binding subunit ClpC